MKQSPIEISIIMPVYNGLKWLDDSVCSVLNQTFKDFEFIIVNDESTDKSYELLQKYAAKDKRIRLFSNKNQGPGESLNFGIRQATGKYLCFIDQDDMYQPNYLEKMLSAIQKYDTDFVVCYAHYFNPEKKIHRPVGYPYFDSGIVDLTHLEKKKELVNWFIPQWTKIIKRDFVLLNDIKFGGRHNKVHDYPFHLLALTYANKITVLNADLYCHRLHEQQITTQVAQDQANGFFATFQDIEDHIQTHQKKKSILIPLGFKMFSYLSLSGQNLKKFNRLLWRYKFGKQFKKIFYNEKIKGNKKKIRLLCFKFSKKIKGKQANDSTLILKGIDCPNVGKHSYCADTVKIANPAETVIGNFVSIGENCRIGNGEHPLNYLSTSPYFYYEELGFKNKEIPAHPEFWNYEGVKIGNDVWIGDNVSIKNGINIGNGAVIGMGAIVTKDVPPYAIVAGVPAKIIRYRFDEKTIKKLLASEWWFLPDEIIKKIPYDDINKAIEFVEKYKKG